MSGEAARATALLERLIDVADDGGRLRETLAGTPLAVTAPLLIDELVFRADDPTNSEPVRIAVDVVDGDERESFVLTLRAGRPIDVARGAPSGEPGMLVEYTATQLVRTLFGLPTGAANAGRRTVPLYGQPREATTVPEPGMVDQVHRAANALFGGTDPERGSLEEYAVRYGADKWGGLHWFTPHYERHFRRFRDRPVRVLEIGIGGFQDPDEGGQSLKLWKRYFRRGIVHGMDVYPKNGLDAPRIRTITADQSDVDTLVALAERDGPYDIVIDDGSHQNEHVLITFAALFPYVRPGGFYVIEDLWTTYVPGYGGTEGGEGGPGTSVGLLKRLIDELHHEEWTGKAEAEPGGPASSLAGMYVYHNIAFLEKGVNLEGGIPEWIRSWPLS
ncbi:class I SAM-dependent methyltransferase [Amycolatopsis sp. NPDC059027]|uniref:class I SAM-dependent methyltransferase n=1 Tax=unclassified Amycolatopsis TaxID=2618356 RepID=UPI00366C05D4